MKHQHVGCKSLWRICLYHHNLISVFFMKSRMKTCYTKMYSQCNYQGVIPQKLTYSSVYTSHITPQPRHTTKRYAKPHHTTPRRATSQHNTTQHNTTQNITDNTISCIMMRFSLIHSSGNTTYLCKGSRCESYLQPIFVGATWSNEVSPDTACDAINCTWRCRVVLRKHTHILVCLSETGQGPLLLTRINFNPGIDT